MIFSVFFFSHIHIHTQTDTPRGPLILFYPSFSRSHPLSYFPPFIFLVNFRYVNIGIGTSTNKTFNIWYALLGCPRHKHTASRSSCVVEFLGLDVVEYSVNQNFISIRFVLSRVFQLQALIEYKSSWIFSVRSDLQNGTVGRANFTFLIILLGKIFYPLPNEDRSKTTTPCSFMNNNIFTPKLVLSDICFMDVGLVWCV